jgi:hypothetical protein
METLFAKLFRWPPAVDDLAFEHSPQHAAFAALGPSAAAFLLDQLASPSLLRRWNAILALTHTPAEHDAIARALCALLVHRNGLLRRHARWALHRLAPSSLPALIDALTQRALRHAALDALTFLGPAAAPAADAIEGLTAGDPLASEALRSLRGPWPEDPASPIQYLGEHLRYYGPESEPNDATDREIEADLWCEQASWFARDHELDALELDDVDRWSDELELDASKYLDRWTPARIVLARREIDVELYDGGSGEHRCFTITSDDEKGWSMAALLLRINALYTTHTNANDRIFEGVERTDVPGRYRLKTGS